MDLSANEYKDNFVSSDRGDNNTGTEEGTSGPDLAEEVPPTSPFGLEISKKGKQRAISEDYNNNNRHGRPEGQSPPKFNGGNPLPPLRKISIMRSGETTSHGHDISRDDPKGISIPNLVGNGPPSLPEPLSSASS